MKKIMKEKNQVVPDEVLSKEFLSQFKTEADVSKFLKQLHAQVLEKMLEGEMDAHLGYEKNSVAGNNTGNSRNGSYPKKIQTEHGESVISIPRDRNSQFEPIAVPKHESRGLSIEKLVISLYAKEMSVSDIEEEMREIYEIELSTWECNLNSVWFLFLLNHNKYNFFFLDLQMLLKVVFGCVQGRRR
ncbi:transposase, partial [Bacteroides thetaiotaomicron]|uniref:transposase n=1 Tax=Bacteroides thetaiotaomicron TaxID=818 RepID=UPI0039C18BAF